MVKSKNNPYAIVKCGLKCPNYHIKLETGNWCWGQGLPPRKVKEGDECHRDYVSKDIERIIQLDSSEVSGRGHRPVHQRSQNPGKLCSFKTLNIIGTLGPI
ncbi:MAG: hypothetical protein WCX73_03630 [Candidatus Pacearchaeota archaeon]|jgi:hypothetical protein